MQKFGAKITFLRGEVKMSILSHFYLVDNHLFMTTNYQYKRGVMSRLKQAFNRNNYQN